MITIERINKIKRFIFIIFITLLILSCSDGINGDLENVNTDNEESFIDLSQAKEIGAGILFNEESDSPTPKKSNSVKATKKTPKSSKRTIKAINEIKNDEGITSFYIINYNEAGFIILSSDKRTQPILAFSEEGTFNVDENSYPDGLKYWLTDTKKQIADIQISNIEQSRENKLAWQEVQNSLTTLSKYKPLHEPPEDCYNHSEIEKVEPLLNSTWEQRGGI